jgi:hypothetical protein
MLQTHFALIEGLRSPRQGLSLGCDKRKVSQPRKERHKQVDLLGDQTASFEMLYEKPRHEPHTIQPRWPEQDPWKLAR